MTETLDQGLDLETVSFYERSVVSGGQGKPSWSLVASVQAHCVEKTEYVPNADGAMEVTQLTVYIAGSQGPPYPEKGMLLVRASTDHIVRQVDTYKDMDEAGTVDHVRCFCREE